MYNPHQEEFAEIDLSIAKDEQVMLLTIREEMLQTLERVKCHMANNSFTSITLSAYEDAFITIEQTLADLLGPDFRRLGAETGEYTLPVSPIQQAWLSRPSGAAVLNRLPNPAMAGFSVRGALKEALKDAHPYIQNDMMRAKIGNLIVKMEEL